MRIDELGWLDAALRLPSPNRDRRPAGMEPELLVIHAMSLPPGEFGGPWIHRLFTNALDPEVHPYFATLRALRVSAHLLVRRDGSLVQYVPFHERAWHAGVSRFGERERCNDFSVGIELEGTDETPFETPQYEALAAAIRVLRARYGTLARAPIVGHADIAPGRKTDPGPRFEWPRLHRLLARSGEGGLG
ncbi:MAG: 1,6-anhydro-N-acetylmuramyl-L-alanine amidase AmpD [Ectothiorhodospira sp.]